MNTLPRDEFRAWLAEVCAIPASNVVWDDEPEPIIGPKAGKLTGLLTVSITSDQNMLWEQRWDDAGDGGAKVTTSAMDTISLSLVYESFESPKKTVARDTLVRIRVKGWQEYFRQKLADLDVVLVDVGTIRQITRVVDDVRISVAQLDISIRFTQLDVVTETPTDFIESVEIFGEVAFPVDLVQDDAVSPIAEATAIADAVSGQPTAFLSDAGASPAASAASVAVSVT